MASAGNIVFQLMLCYNKKQSKGCCLCVPHKNAAMAEQGADAFLLQQ